MITVERAKEIKVANVMCKTSLLFHTAYFYKHREQQRFIINSHHQRICEVLEMVMKGLLVKVVISVAPRYGKTELAVINLVTHAFALNATARFIHLSYSHDLVNTNSEVIKNTIKSEAYQTLFPDVRIKTKSDSKKKWSTTAGGAFYATSTGGQVTGFGAGKVDDPEKAKLAEEHRKIAILKQIDQSFEEISKELEAWDDITTKEGFNGALIIDDAIKPEDADSETKRTRINERYDSTLKNRVNSRRTPIVMIGQRTHEKDLSGHVMETDGFTEDLAEAMQNPNLWYLLSLPAIVDELLPTEHALWDFKHTLPELKAMQIAAPISFGRQYQQNPQPKEGFMYSPFRTYKDEQSIPLTLKSIRKAYVDTADTGNDYLCSIAYHETESAIYVIDVIYTTEKMETTEPAVALQLAKFKIQKARFESNNGGRSFARAVETQTRVIKNYLTNFEWFHQVNNKQVRIFNESNKVNNLVYMPEDWARRWPLFYKSITTYKKSGKNGHDDAEDALTGVAEYFGKDLLTPIDNKVLSIFH